MVNLICKYLTDKSKPIIFCRFVGSFLGSGYGKTNKLSDAKDKANQALSEYNDQNPRMDLDIFDDDAKHFRGITNIITYHPGIQI